MTETIIFQVYPPHQLIFHGISETNFRNLTVVFKFRNI